MILLFIVITYLKYGKQFKDLDKKEHPLKCLYGSGYGIFLLLKRFQNKNQRENLLSELLIKKNVSREYIIFESKKYAYFLGILWISIILCLLMSVNLKSNLKDGNLLKRPGYGDDSVQYELKSSYSGDDDIFVSVDARTYPKEKLDEIFEAVYQELLENLLGENKSLSQVNEDLVFAQSKKYLGVVANWLPREHALISSLGKVNLTSVPKEGRDTSIQLTLSCQDKEEKYDIFITLVPKVQTKEEEIKNEFMNFLKIKEESDRTEEYFSLPTKINGEEVSYYEEKSKSTAILLLLLGILAAILIVVNENSKLKNQMQVRERQMMVDYPQIVSKLTIFIGAGMSVKAAWFRIVKDYQMHRGGEKRFAYEEMIYTSKQMLDGMTEAQAYLEFGKRCRLHTYLKFSSLLEQNLRKGTRGLVSLLQNETDQAFLERKHIARRYGEKMSTRLMIPMMIFFAMVLAMIMVPAMLSF